MLNKEIIYLISIALIFYVFGVVLSNIINNIFPACNFERKDGIIIAECVIQLVILYTIIFCLIKISSIIEGFYKKLTKKTIPGFYTSIILVSFSIGIFKHLENLNERTGYLKKKLFN